MRRQYLEARVGQRAMEQMPQIHVQMGQQAVGLDHAGQARGAGAHERAAPLHAAGVEAPALAVHHAIDEHAVEPALHDGRHREPPQRELQDQHVAREQLVDLRLDVRREGLVFVGMLLLTVVLQRIGEAPLAEVLGTGDRIEAHGIEIGHHDLVPLLLQHLYRAVQQAAVEGFGFRVGVDDQYVHRQGACALLVISLLQ
ncbi:hypothetical protein D3C85_1289360 [compost metagenome]